MSFIVVTYRSMHSSLIAGEEIIQRKLYQQQPKQKVTAHEG